jgi:hypothetical protein
MVMMFELRLFVTAVPGILKLCKTVTAKNL